MNNLSFTQVIMSWPGLILAAISVAFMILYFYKLFSEDTSRTMIGRIFTSDQLASLDWREVEKLTQSISALPKRLRLVIVEVLEERVVLEMKLHAACGDYNSIRNLELNCRNCEYLQDLSNMNRFFSQIQAGIANATGKGQSLENFPEIMILINSWIKDDNYPYAWADEILALNKKAAVSFGEAIQQTIETESTLETAMYIKKYAKFINLTKINKEAMLLDKKVLEAAKNILTPSLSGISPQEWAKVSMREIKVPVAEALELVTNWLPPQEVLA